METITNPRFRIQASLLRKTDSCKTPAIIVFSVYDGITNHEIFKDKEIDYAAKVLLEKYPDAALEIAQYYKSGASCDLPQSVDIRRMDGGARDTLCQKISQLAPKPEEIPVPA